jgi:hypothetical protein
LPLQNSGLMKIRPLFLFVAGLSRQDSRHAAAIFLSP